MIRMENWMVIGISLQETQNVGNVGTGQLIPTKHPEQPCSCSSFPTLCAVPLEGIGDSWRDLFLLFFPPLSFISLSLSLSVPLLFWGEGACMHACA